MNYRHWINYFEANRFARPEPAWDAPLTLPEPKRRALAESLAEYQLGDGGGPCRLIARGADLFRHSSAEVERVVDLWFAEEREHSRLLSGAVQRLRGRLLTETIAFRLFCGLRRALGVEGEMLVLLLVEIVSTGYYRLIRRHAGDPPIEAMCRLILGDEAGHIAFHRDRLAERHPGGMSGARQMAFQVLGMACAALLWIGHGRKLRAIGATRVEFFQLTRFGLRRFLKQLRAPHRRLATGTRTVASPPVMSARAPAPVHGWATMR